MGPWSLFPGLASVEVAGGGVPVKKDRSGLSGVPALLSRYLFCTLGSSFLACR